MTQLIIEVSLYLLGTIVCYLIAKKFSVFVSYRMHSNLWIIAFLLVNLLLIGAQHYSIMENGTFFLLDFIDYQFSYVTRLIAIPAMLLQCTVFPKRTAAAIKL